MTFEIPDWGGSDVFSYHELGCSTSGKLLNKQKSNKKKKLTVRDTVIEGLQHPSKKRISHDSGDTQHKSKKKKKEKNTSNEDTFGKLSQSPQKKTEEMIANQQSCNESQEHVKLGKGDQDTSLQINPINSPLTLQNSEVKKTKKNKKKKSKNKYKDLYIRQIEGKRKMIQESKGLNLGCVDNIPWPSTDMQHTLKGKHLGKEVIAMCNGDLEGKEGDCSIKDSIASVDHKTKKKKIKSKKKCRDNSTDRGEENMSEMETILHENDQLCSVAGEDSHALPDRERKRKKKRKIEDSEANLMHEERQAEEKMSPSKKKKKKAIIEKSVFLGGKTEGEIKSPTIEKTEVLKKIERNAQAEETETSTKKNRSKQNMINLVEWKGEAEEIGGPTSQTTLSVINKKESDGSVHELKELRKKKKEKKKHIKSEVSELKDMEEKRKESQKINSSTAEPEGEASESAYEKGNMMKLKKRKKKTRKTRTETEQDTCENMRHSGQMNERKQKRTEKSEGTSKNDIQSTKVKKTLLKRNKGEDDDDNTEELAFGDDENECDANFQSDFNTLLMQLNFSNFHKTDRKGKDNRTQSNAKDSMASLESEEKDVNNDDDTEEEEKVRIIKKKMSKSSHISKKIENKANIPSNKSLKMHKPDSRDNQRQEKGEEVKTSKVNADVDGSPQLKKERVKFDKKILAQLDDAKSPSEHPVNTADTLKQKMEKRLTAAKFRLLNEELYTTTSEEAVGLFNSDPEAFSRYHQGYQDQVKCWPVSPLNLIIDWLHTKPKKWVVADLGCGEALLALRVPQTKVHSLDLVAANSRVISCDMAHTPLAQGSIDVTVYCLSLMGTNIKDFLVEANRILREGGIMKIAEVESRFEDTNQFIILVSKYGFHLSNKDTSRPFFHLFEFKKYRKIKKGKLLPEIILKPCVYKKR